MASIFVPGEGYPLGVADLTRWNTARPGGHLGCPRHRSPLPLVADLHETTGDPVWGCSECGYTTPILDDELRTALGAVDTFTVPTSADCLQATSRYDVLPAHPASRPASGHVAIADPSQSRVDDIAFAIVGLGLVFVPVLIILCLIHLPTYAAALLLVSATSVGGAVALGGIVLRRSRPANTLVVGDRRVDDAGHVLPGQWISREVTRNPPAQGLESLLYVEWSEGPSAATQLGSKNLACRVLQNVRVGTTMAVRITTTAGTFTTADTTPITAVQMPDPTLNDFTYHPRD